MDPILTISIPTFNRPHQIQTQVRLILPQLNEQVCLVVYDNFSVLPVKSLFSDEELLKFTIVNNRVNIGGDANIARCFENCTTHWLWTLSDDDYVKDNSVDIIINEILHNKEDVFINFNNEFPFKVVGFKQLTYRFKCKNTFSNSFAMSSCVYNISKLYNYLEYYYDNLSSMVGTIILVVKYMENNNNATCTFSNKTPINKYNTEVGWNYGKFINRSKLFIDAFGGKNFSPYNKTLFLGCHNTNYFLIILNRKESFMSYNLRWKAYVNAVNNQGLYNAFKYSTKLFIKTLLYLLFSPIISFLNNTK